MPISDRLTTKLVSRARLLALAPATCLLLAQPVSAQSSSAMAQAEIQRRANNATEAQELLKKGDESYTASKWADAVAAYTGARELLPDAPATRELRKAATERLAQASVALAAEQRRLGDVSGAKATVDKVLDASVAPDNGLALEMRDQLNDPIRTNPAVTKEDGQDAEEVRLLLYKAEGSYNLGDYDKAAHVYEEVLRTDPYNKAARRGMERVAQQRADYARAAYDEARADMLSQVDEAWQLRVRPGDVTPEDLTGGPAVDSQILVGNKLERITLPIVDFQEVTIQEAFDFLRAQSVDLDNLELDPAKRGINFVLELGSGEQAAKIKATKITLQLRGVPLSQVVKHICDMTNTVSIAQEWAVAIRPVGADSTEMMTRSFRVQPDFLTSGAASVGATNARSDDPFAENNPGGEGLLVRRLSAEEILKQQGVDFPAGASANFNSGNSTLTVRNTPANLGLVEQIAEAMAGQEPAMVIVEVKMLKTQERVLKELGFDWLLGEFSLGGSGLTPGVAAGWLTGGAQDPANLSDVALAPGVTERLGLTSGNRSGDEAILSDSIDDLILEQQSGFARGKARAPGILWANGTINNTNLTMLMRGLNQKKNIDLVVAPSTTSRSGQQTTVEVIREFIYPTEYEPPELPNNVGGGVGVDFETGELFGGSASSFPVTPATPTSFETKNVGVMLDVLPTVSEDRHYVDIAVKPSVTDFDGFVNYGTPITSPGTDALGNPTTTVVTPNEILMPVFSVMKSETSLTVADGATLVIGGLLQERVQKVEDKVPVLGDIPLAGRFFRSEANAPVRTAIVFFVTVKVVDATGRTFSSR